MQSIMSKNFNKFKKNLLQSALKPEKYKINKLFPGKIPRSVKWIKSSQKFGWFAENSFNIAIVHGGAGSSTVKCAI